MKKKISFGINKSEYYLLLGLFSLIISVILGFLLIGNDMQSLLRWDLCLFLLGFSVLPLTGIVFKTFRYKGYHFSKVIGLTISSYIVWVLSDLHILRFNSMSCILITLIICLITYLLYFVFCKKKLSMNSCREVFLNLFGNTVYSLERILINEGIFMLLFVFCTYMLGQKIPGSDTERFMNYGFMNMLSKCDYMPPKDMWAALESINYYYYGHYMCTFISKLSVVKIAEAYSLSINMLWTFVVVFSFSIVFELLNAIDIVKEKFMWLGGIVAAIAVGISGNMHYVVFYKIIPTLWDMLGLEGNKPYYWFASSTRYIGYTPVNTADQTIEEFPSYIILLGDLHAHAIDMMIVLTILAMLIAYAIDRRKIAKNGPIAIEGICSTIAKLLNVNLIITSLLLAVASMTNYWDYPIYLLISVAFMLVINLILYGNKLLAYLLSVLQGGVCFVLSRLLNLLFMKQFDKMFDGIGIVTSRSYLSQLLVLWGLPVTCVIVFAFFVINKKLFGEGGLNTDSRGLYGILINERISDLIVLGLSICAIGLIAIPEFIFVKDIYINGFPRANTMYKLTFEAFILFGLSMGYIFTRILSSKISDECSVASYVKARSIKRMAMLLFILWIFTSCYIFTAITQWMGKASEREYIGIDASINIRSILGVENEVVDFINNNIPGDEVILVADGDSYTSSCMIPALTGHPTVLGWNTHEWLWHNSYDYVSKRSEDVRRIYQASDLQELKKLLEGYDVKYVYIGSKEMEKYESINRNALLSLGDIIYSNNELASCIIRLD